MVSRTGAGGAAIIVYVSQVSGGSKRGGDGAAVGGGGEPDVGGYNNVQCCQVSGPAARRLASSSTRSFRRTVSLSSHGLAALPQSLLLDLTERLRHLITLLLVHRAWNRFSNNTPNVSVCIDKHVSRLRVVMNVANNYQVYLFP